MTRKGGTTTTRKARPGPGKRAAPAGKTTKVKADAAEAGGKKKGKAGAKAALDDGGSRGDQSKRLLDLVMILLAARSPVTYREIREQFAAYQTLNVEAGLRAFERDKADLLELGVPIRYITPEEDDSLEDGGYVIDLKRFRLPEVRLTTDEVSALVLAASVARAVPGGSYPKIVDLALKKLAFDLPEIPDTPTEFPRPSGTRPRETVLVHFPEQRAPAAEAISENFATLEAATRFKKRVTMKYQTAATGMTSTRDVDPYALVYRDATWLLVGWCHLRKEIRSFRVDRMADVVMAPKPKSPDFERPADLDVKAYVHRSPWTFTTEPVEQVVLELGPEAADTAHEDFGPEAVKTTRGDHTIVALPCGNPEFAVSKILAAKGAIVVREGDQLRRRVEAELAAIALRYDGGAVMRDVAQKLRRLLFIVPYVAKYPEGVPVEKLAKLLGADRDELLADLDLLSQVGPPDGDPGEYLLVSVEDGRVFVDLAHRLTRPLRLTPAEGCSLLLGIRALKESGIAPFDASMESAEKKLLGALGRDAREAESLATSTVVAEPDRVVAGFLRELVTATRKAKRVDIEYVSASRHQAERRKIDPYGLVHHAGEWYVVGFCHKRGDVRTFRIDRVASLTVLPEAFQPPAEFDLEAYRREQLYVPSADAVTVRIHLEPLAVTRIGANWPVGEVTVGEDGSAELLIDCEGYEWVTGWVLGLGRHAWIQTPEDARAAMRDRLARTRAALALA